VRRVILPGIAALCAAPTVSTQAPKAPPAPDRATAAVLYIDRNCTDEYGRDLCEARIRDFIVRSFGLAPAESLPPNRAPQVRAFTIDGYSRDLPALVFTGADGAGARLDIYSQMATPAATGRASVSPFARRTPAPVGSWRTPSAGRPTRFCRRRPRRPRRGSPACRLRRLRNRVSTAGRPSWRSSMPAG
jgi:hypothetical protein